MAGGWAGPSVFGGEGGVSLGSRSSTSEIRSCSLRPALCGRVWGRPVGEEVAEAGRPVRPCGRLGGSRRSHWGHVCALSEPLEACVQPHGRVRLESNIIHKAEREARAWESEEGVGTPRGLPAAAQDPACPGSQRHSRPVVTASRSTSAPSRGPCHLCGSVTERPAQNTSPPRAAGVGGSPRAPH